MQHVACCKSTYRMRKLKNRGAIVVLVWNFFIASVFDYLLAFVVPNSLAITIIALGLTLPFAGWLADIRFGRYKVICWSIWIMWTAFMLATLNSVIEQFVPGHHNIFKLISETLTFILAIGFGGYQANIIQFGLDQLQDASTTEITAFITWYVWTFFCNGALLDFTHVCLTPEYYIFGQLIVCTSITVAITSFFFFDNSLIKEPVTQNPFKLIYKVLRYFIENKHPRYRSAFTYCEDELPSRIDFGKSKYGGPFTTEQVEDVKTFLRLLAIISIISALASEFVVMLKFNQTLNKLFQHDISTLSFKECYTERFSTLAFGSIAIATFIPLHEFIIYPFLQKCFSSTKIYQKFIASVLLQMTRIVILMIYNVTARKTPNEHHEHFLSLSSYRNWMAIPNFLGIVSNAVLSISTIEFVASQTPYSMRGLIVGAGYGSVFVFAMIGYGIYWPFTHQSSTWATGMYSREFWYLLFVLLTSLFISGILVVVGRWYKQRKREDVLPNEHIFAERYYAQGN